MKKIYIVLFLSILCGLSATNIVNGLNWSQKNSFPGSRNGAFGFSIGLKGYVGSGLISTPFGITVINDFWEYDKATDQWTQKMSMPGTGRVSAATFTGFGKGYVTTGYDMTNYLQDTWQYDPVSNIWIAMPDFPGGPRYTCAYFNVSDDGYVGMGKSLGCFSDFYRFDGLSNTWNAIAPIPGTPRQSAKGFGIGNFGYVVGGAEESALYDSKELWCYDPLTDTWVQKSNYPGNGSHGLAGFVMSGYGFVGCGTTLTSGLLFSDFHNYNPLLDSWTPITNFGGGIRAGSVSMTIGNTGFIGMGADVIFPQVNYFSDWWSFDNTIGIEESADAQQQVIAYFNNGDLYFQLSSQVEKNSQVYIFDGSGKLVSTNVIHETGNTFILKNFHPAKGIYYYNITSTPGNTFSGKVAASL